MDYTTNTIAAIAITFIFFIVGMAVYQDVAKTRTCRELSGVPVRYHGGSNCQKDGAFIDLGY